MKKLIVNADDFGFTSGVNAGILRAFRDGIVTSTTIMANGPAFDEAAEMARNNRDLAVGCHLSILGGRPVAQPTEVPSLVDPDGLMPKTLSELISRLTCGVVQIGHIEREFCAQVERVMKAGLCPTHLDCHKHAHTHPRVLEALLRVATEVGVKKIRNPFESLHRPKFSGPEARRRWRVYLKQYALAMSLRTGSRRFRRLAGARGLRMPDHFCGMTLTGLMDLAAIGALIAGLAEGVTELACHPGIYDRQLECSPTRLKQERERELQALTDPTLRRRIADHGVILISYRDV